MDLTDNEISHERLITKDPSPTASYEKTFNNDIFIAYLNEFNGLRSSLEGVFRELYQ